MSSGWIEWPTRPPIGDILNMRIVIGGDASWRCDSLASAVLRRLIVRYGSEIVIAHSGRPGVDQSFALACRELGIASHYYPVDFSHLGDHRFQHREMLRPGAGLCVIFHRSAFDERTMDLAKQAIEAGVPTYLIEDERGTPRRLRAIPSSA
jgi:hypothetical protein